MKKHISITIDGQLIQLLKKIAVSNHSSLSRIMEIAAADYAQRMMVETTTIPGSDSSFQGSFSRTETYEK